MGVKLAGFYVRSVPKLQYNEEEGKYEVSAESEQGKHEGAWMFLFIDLILVALISKISMAVEECELSSHTMTFQCVMFISMFMTRLHMDDYVNRFYTNDVFHRFFYFVYIMAFFIMALNVNIADSDHTHSDARCHANLYSYGYGIGFLLSRLSLLVMYLSVMMEDRRAFEQFFSCVARTALSMFLVVVFLWYEQQQLSQGEKGAFVPEYRMYIYLVACFVEWGAMSAHYLLLGLKRAGHDIHPIFLGIEYFPINVETYQERFGAFILMVLGEAIIMICVPYFDVQNPSDTYTFNIVACLIVWAYGVMYFDACAGAEEQDHAMEHSLLSAYLYTWLHLFLGMAMFYTSSMIGMLYHDIVNTSVYSVELLEPPEDDGAEKKEWNHQRLCRPEQLLAASVAITIFFFACMRMLHAHDGHGIWRLFDCTCSSRAVISDQVGFLWRLGCAVFHLTVPSYKMPRPSMNCGVHMVFLVIMLVLETEVGGQKSMLSVMDGAVNAKMQAGLADKDAQRDGHASGQHDVAKSKTASSLPPRRHDVEFGEPSESRADEVPGAEGGGDDGIPHSSGAEFGYDDAYSHSDSFHASATSALALGMYSSSSSSSSSRASGSLSSRASASKRASKGSSARRASANKQ